MADLYVCPSCDGNTLDWTVPDRRGYQWTIKVTDESMPLCTRCANEEHPAHGLAIDMTKGLRPGAARQQDRFDRWRDVPNANL